MASWPDYLTKKAKCILRTEITETSRYAEFMYENRDLSCSFVTFNIVTELSDKFKLVWTAKGVTTTAHGETCRYEEIELKKYHGSYHGTFRIFLDDELKPYTSHSFCASSFPSIWRFKKCQSATGKLRIKFQIFYEDQPSVDPVFPKEEIVLTLLDDYEKLLDNQEFSDVIFVFDKEEIRANKLIMSTRCDVFARMFNSNMLEKETGRVEITDIEPTIFKQLLRFIYCGKMESNETDDLFKLILAANKYSMIGLVKICADLLSSDLSVDNAVDCLIIADRVNEDSLKKMCINMIIENKRDAAIAEGYKKLKKFHVDLALQILDCVMK